MSFMPVSARMAIGIFPIAVLVAAVAAGLLVSVAVRLGRQVSRGQRLGWGHLAVLAAWSTSLWVAWSFFFALLAALGHSAHPWADSWRHCLAGFVVFMVAPAAVLLWQAAEAGSLRTIKLIHTVVWAFFAGCIFAIPVLAWLGQLRTALVFIGIVFLEVLVLVINGMRCPLTAVAARYTDDRRDNFDIYLPEWLARNNKTVFGLLYLLGIAFTIARWARWLP